MRLEWVLNIKHYTTKVISAVVVMAARRRDMHGHGWRGHCQGIPLRACGCVLHVAAADCELLSLFVTIFHAKLLLCVFLVCEAKNFSFWCLNHILQCAVVF